MTDLELDNQASRIRVVKSVALQPTGLALRVGVMIESTPRRTSRKAFCGVLLYTGGGWTGGDADAC